MQIEIKRPSVLSPREIEAWRAIQASDPALASPYFCPEFSLAADAVRRDARVAVISRSGAPVAFFPYQTGPLGVSRPIGGPFSDFHGLIAEPDAVFDLAEVAARAGIALYGYDFVPAGQTRHGLRGEREDFCHIIGLEQGYDAYRAEAEQRTGAFKTLESRRRRMERDFADVRIVLDDRSDVAFETLIAWKRAQFRATGYFDVFSVDWTEALLMRLRAERGESFSGLVSSLYLDGRLAAVHFGIRSAAALHYWFPAYDPAYGRYSVGNILLDALARGGARMGWTQIHLGPGDYRYKLEFASRQAALIGGVLRTASFCGHLHETANAAQAGLERAGLTRLSRLTGKALRRLDHHLAFRAGA